MPSRAHSSVTRRTLVTPAAMPFDPRQAPLPRPAPVAVHDDGDVPRQPLPRNVGQFGGYVGWSRHVSGQWQRESVAVNR